MTRLAVGRPDDTRTLESSVVRKEDSEIQKVGRINALDSLRGLVALIVVWHHVFKLFPEVFALLRLASPGAYLVAAWVADLNKTAVLGFFVLSGVSIRLAISREDLFAPGGLARYARRRAARILPLYWLALVFTALLGPLHDFRNESFGFPTLVGNLLFLQTSESARGVWFSPFGLNGPLWSLSYEVFYYALAPLCLLALGRLRALQTHTLNAFLLASFAVSLAAIALSVAAPNPFASFLSVWGIWVYGFVLGDTLIHARFDWILIFPLPAALLISLVAQHAALHSATLGMLVDGFVIGTIFMGGRELIRRLPLAVSTVLGKGLNAAVFRIGRGSYALYLLHYPALLATVSLTNKWSLAPPIMVFVLAAEVSAFALFVCPWIEGQLRAPGRRWFGASEANLTPDADHRAEVSAERQTRS